MLYKRNQVEEAISQILEDTTKPSEVLRTRIKRLLQLDRNLGVDRRSSDPEKAHYAFFSGPPPGTGSEVGFSGYEAFALLHGLKMMRHQWSQGVAVSIFRRIRPELEPRHTRILSAYPEETFDEARKGRNNKNYEAFRRDRQFLLLITDTKTEDMKPYPRLFDKQNEIIPFLIKEPGRASTWFELVVLACRLRDILNRTQPRQRGRSS